MSRVRYGIRVGARSFPGVPGRAFSTPSVYIPLGISQMQFKIDI